MFVSLKAKLIAVGSLFVIALFAALKWLYASNQAKAEKIQELKRDAGVAKKVSSITADVAEYKGYQKAIDSENQRVADVTQKADDARGDMDESNHSFTSVRI